MLLLYSVVVSFFCIKVYLVMFVCWFCEVTAVCCCRIVSGLRAPFMLMLWWSCLGCNFCTRGHGHCMFVERRGGDVQARNRT
jgi:hypothetical protein